MTMLSEAPSLPPVQGAEWHGGEWTIHATCLSCGEVSRVRLGASLAGVRPSEPDPKSVLLPLFPLTATESKRVPDTGARCPACGVGGAMRKRAPATVVACGYCSRMLKLKRRRNAAGVEIGVLPTHLINADEPGVGECPNSSAKATDLSCSPA